jgi:hypothetical protein
MAPIAAPAEFRIEETERLRPDTSLIGLYQNYSRNTMVFRYLSINAEG